MRNLLQLQALDLKIERLKKTEVEIPRQKEKYDTQKSRLSEELKKSEDRVKKLQIEQRECEVDIDQKNTQIKKYESQLLGVKKNEEYQALLHEIEMQKKQIGLKEERILNIMEEMDKAKAQLEEDKKRIAAEQKEIDGECRKIDGEFDEAVERRKELEGQRSPIIAEIDPGLLTKYNRIRVAKKTGPAAVPLRGEHCSGCNMKVTAQVVNEILADKIHTCHHCGRILYHAENFEQAQVVETGS